MIFRKKSKQLTTDEASFRAAEIARAVADIQQSLTNIKAATNIIKKCGGSVDIYGTTNLYDSVTYKKRSEPLSVRSYLTVAE